MPLTFEKDDVLNNNIPPEIIGAYYFLDSSDNILYIGKSIDVKKRISQHLYKEENVCYLHIVKLELFLCTQN